MDYVTCCGAILFSRVILNVYVWTLPKSFVSKEHVGM